jgi:hypothetical protein
MLPLASTPRTVNMPPGLVLHTAHPHPVHSRRSPIATPPRALARRPPIRLPPKPQVVHIGDSITKDLLGALRCGCRVVRLPKLASTALSSKARLRAPCRSSTVALSVGGCQPRAPPKLNVAGPRIE